MTLTKERVNIIWEIFIVIGVIMVIVLMALHQANKQSPPPIPKKSKPNAILEVADHPLPPLKINVEGCERQEGLSAEFCADFTQRVAELAEASNPKKAAANLELTVLLAPQVERGKLVISMEIKLGGKTKSYYRFAQPGTVTRKCGVAFNALYNWIINNIQPTEPPEENFRAAVILPNKKTAKKAAA